MRRKLGLSSRDHPAVICVQADDKVQTVDLCCDNFISYMYTGMISIQPRIVAKAGMTC